MELNVSFSISIGSSAPEVEADNAEECSQGSTGNVINAPTPCESPALYIALKHKM